MELSCLLTLYLWLAPLGAPSKIDQSYRTGGCETYQTSAQINPHGILHIENEFMEYEIPLPIHIDKAWITYRMGDEYAYLGNCAPNQHPFGDTFCDMIMTRIGLVGWQ